MVIVVVRVVTAAVVAAVEELRVKVMLAKT